MKLSKILDCQSSLKSLYDQPIEDFETLVALFDLIAALDNQADKYSSLYNKLIQQYGHEKVEASGKYEIDDDNKEAFEIAMTNLQNVDFEWPKKKIAKIVATPRQYSYLKEFFEFE